MKVKILPQLKSAFKLTLLVICMMMAAGSVWAQQVTIVTDKDDYWPGEWVIITGSGWTQDESVKITLTHIEPNIPDHEHEPWYLTPDSDGNLYYEWFVFDEELGTAFHLTALGMTTGWFAETWFTDAYQTQIVNIGPSEGICGEEISVTAQLQYKETGNGPWLNAAGETLVFTLGANTTTAITDANGVATAVMTISQPVPTVIEVDYAGSGSGNTALQKKENVTNPITVTTAVANAGPITGENAICANESGMTYSIEPVSGALTYTWTVPAGASIASGQGTTSITVNFGETSGNVTVTPSNGCGAGSTSFKAVTINPLPNNVSGGFVGNTICVGEAGRLTFDAINSTFVIPYTIEYTDGVTTWSQLIESASVVAFDVAVAPVVTTPYRLVSITNGNGCVRTSGIIDATAQITVRPLPVCAITGVDDPVCPSSSTVFEAPIALATYSWSVSGDASIDGPINQQAVTIISGSSNNSSYTVSLTVTNSYGCSSTCEKTVLVADDINPTALAQNVTIYLDATGNASTTAEAVNNGSTDNCGIQSLALDVEAFTCANVGDNNVVLTVTDVNGNSSTANAVVTVVDDINPTALAQNVTIYLDADGNASTTAADVNNGSTDNCGIASLELDITAFTCANVGDNDVVLTVTDVNGNSSTANAVVTVVDDIDPTALAQNVTI
ncbi:MAG: hypothetical protein AB7U05_07615, partial [Mangrovibacterium sp.]